MVVNYGGNVKVQNPLERHWPFEDSLEWATSMEVAKNYGIVPGVRKLCELTTHSKQLSSAIMDELSWNDGDAIEGVEQMTIIAWTGARSVFLQRCIDDRIIISEKATDEEVNMYQVATVALERALHFVKTATVKN
jgi:hypothetical protein